MIYIQVLNIDRWGLATCIPPVLLGEDGYLPKHQTSLECLTLITFATCRAHFEGYSRLDLSRFRNLQSFTWKGLLAEQDIPTLRDCIQANASQLEDLSVDLVDELFENSWEDERDGASLIKHLAGIRNGQIKPALPRLKTLALESVRLNGEIQPLIHGLNITGLRSLKLWNCSYSAEFLKEIGESNVDLHISSFELVGDCDVRGLFSDSDTLPRFLGKLKFIRELYLLVPAGASDLITESILEHKSTLTRFVFHERIMDDDDDSPRYGEGCDSHLIWNE